MPWLGRVGADLGYVSAVAVSQAGNGLAGDESGGMATASTVDLPTGVALDGAGNFYVADTSNYRDCHAAAAGPWPAATGGAMRAYYYAL
ncbi:hypothetical protein DMH04_27820 [Kibdelosporangium aridum]|uniref:NHL repeat-containing protein n=1 Tax=Kibdelosporangium aridum TaxID=2030 RepID=A0A428Z4W2_KIBAR|nr:hypothetical protein [Kibdelosporangium aridum]RSM81677.1 hypothetical protein DMH04_27820 [Kibdelosporangium aridum]